MLSIKMPVNSSRFNRILRVLVTSSLFFPALTGISAELSPSHYTWLGEQIFRNECNSRTSCLTSWNAGEDFPSLGIGHFIWYQKGQEEIFEETFPALLTFFGDKGIVLPEWLKASAAAENPWRDRDSFNQAQQSGRMKKLRDLLLLTAPLQAEFIVHRFNITRDRIVSSFESAEQARARQVIDQLATIQPPYGQYALIDYLHFKGSGLNPAENYQGTGWGLKQVIKAMLGQQVSLETFARAATAVLDQRIENAPPARDESRWQAGWHNRIKTYLPPGAVSVN